MTSAITVDAVQIAREAGALVLAAFGQTQSEAKGRFDLVTPADRAADAHILQRLRERYPGCAVVAEESGVQAGTADLRWFVDPLDGSKNFVRGYPAFAVSLAAADARGLLAGVIFDPLRDELFMAERGGGAYCNGQRIQVAATPDLGGAVITTGYPSATRHRPPRMDLLSALAMATQGLRRSGSSALDLAYVACGRVDAFWDTGLGSWDVAAGALLVAEAGGRCTAVNGHAFEAGGGDVLAAGAAVHGALLALLNEGPP